MWYKFKGLSLLFLLPLLSFGNIDLVIKETVGIDRVNEIVHNGIPIDRNSGLDASNIHIEDASGKSVNAQFEVLSRWAGGVQSRKPMQWLLVTFPASVRANNTAVYKIKKGRVNHVGKKLTVNQDVNFVTVNTGVAEFVISRTKFNVFESAKYGATNMITNGGNAVIKVGGKDLMIAGPPTEVKIEHKGDLFVTVKVAGNFNNPPFAGVAWRYIARYSFYLGSPTAEIDFYYAMPGNKSGTSSFNVAKTSDNAKIEKVTLNLPLRANAPAPAYVSAENNSVLEGVLNANEIASLEQTLRSKMTKPAVYNMALGGSSKSGMFAEKPMVGVGGVSVSIDKMKFYEPQSIVATPNKFEINIVADKQWLGPYMGAYAKVSVTLRETASPWKYPVSLDNRIMAWPTLSYVSNMGIFDELWDGKANPQAETYWNKVKMVSENTLAGYIRYGMYGFMTYGVVPRYWGYKNHGNEFGNTGTWDGYYLKGTFTDYHNAFSNVVRQFARENDSKWLRDLAFPAARRTLNTQIVQDYPTSNIIFSGWAPIGYGNYRKDFNSSHSYFENLFFYYYLTGDRRVIDVLLPGGNHVRKMYARKPDGTLVPPDKPPLRSWMETELRQPSQFAAIYWFLGHASKDSTFLGDYLNQYQRLVARNTALIKKDGVEYTFFFKDMEPNVTGGVTTQSWATGLFSMQNLYYLYNEYGDLTLYNGIKISRLFIGKHRMYWEYLCKVKGDGTPAGHWANMLKVSWTGNKLGGTVSSVSLANVNENLLYPVSKPCILNVMLRSAIMSKDPVLFNKGSEMLKYLIDLQDPNYPWGKAAAMAWTRVHGAVGLYVKALSGDTIIPPPPPDTTTPPPDTTTPPPDTTTPPPSDTCISDTVFIKDTVHVKDTILIDSCIDVGDSLYTPSLKIQRTGDNIEIECNNCSTMKVVTDPNAIGSDDSIRLRMEKDQAVVYFKPWKFYVID